MPVAHAEWARLVEPKIGSRPLTFECVSVTVDVGIPTQFSGNLQFLPCESPMLYYEDRSGRHIAADHDGSRSWGTESDGPRSPNA
jgi:hypothetical protein